MGCLLDGLGLMGRGVSWLHADDKNPEHGVCTLGTLGQKFDVSGARLARRVLRGEKTMLTV